MLKNRRFTASKTIAVIMSMTILLCASLTGCGGDESSGSIAQNVQLAPLTSEGDEKLFDNPDRGYRTEFVFYVKRTKKSDETYDARTVFVDRDEESIRKAIQSVFDIYIYNKPEKAKLSLSYIYITDWRDKELDENLLNFFKIYFEMCREQKIKNMLRICYCSGTSRLDEGADQITIIRHIKQLKDTIAEYADTIHTISCGFVGAYGEWADVYQYPSVDYATIIKAVTEHLAVPNNLFFSIRSPKYKNLVGSDYEYYWSISHNNDAMFGLQTKGWNSDDYEVGTPEWEQVTKEAAYTPQGGEMFVNSNLLSTGRVPSGMEILLECYAHRHTSMSFWHGYLDAYKDDNVIKRWQVYEQVTAEILTANNVIYDPNWFLNSDGSAAYRNPYEFIRDHLGYRLVGKNVNVNWSGELTDKINVDLEFNNYGFAAAFNMMSSFAVLDSEYNLVSEISAGDPHTWYNRDPENPSSTEVLTHNISAALDAPQAKGSYYIAFNLKNTMGTTAALANNIPYENGYNILYSFKVK